MTKWRPIALCNILYTIILKVLTNRLKQVLLGIVNLNQSEFVAERLITDNILIVHEILHSLKLRKGTDNRSLAIKLDMAKAYDRVEWPFPVAILKALGFCDLFCSWVYKCISIVSYSILLN